MSFSSLTIFFSFPFWLLYPILIVGYAFGICDNKIRRHCSIGVLTIISIIITLIIPLLYTHIIKQTDKLMGCVGLTCIPAPYSLREGPVCNLDSPLITAPLGNNYLLASKTTTGP